MEISQMPSLKPSSALIRNQKRSKNRLYLVILILFFVSLQTGCYHYHVTAPKPDPATEYESRTVHSYLWGLIQSDNVEASDCLSNALDEVHITNNFGYSVVTVVTLGIWAPLDVQWRCAKEPSPDGEI